MLYPCVLNFPPDSSPARFLYSENMCSLSGSVEWYKMDVDENNETTLTCVAQPCEHDDIVTTLSLNASKNTAVTGSHDCR